MATENNTWLWMRISNMTNYVFNICVIYKLVVEIKNIFRSENSLKRIWEWFFKDDWLHSNCWWKIDVTGYYVNWETYQAFQQIQISYLCFIEKFTHQSFYRIFCKLHWNYLLFSTINLENLFKDLNEEFDTPFVLDLKKMCVDGLIYKEFN